MCPTKVLGLVSHSSCAVQSDQDDQKVVQAADVAQAAFEGDARQKENGAAESREAPVPAKKEKPADDGHLTEKEGRATGEDYRSFPHTSAHRIDVLTCRLALSLELSTHSCCACLFVQASETQTFNCVP